MNLADRALKQHKYFLSELQVQTHLLCVNEVYLLYLQLQIVLDLLTWSCALEICAFLFQPLIYAQLQKTFLSINKKLRRSMRAHGALVSFETLTFFCCTALQNVLVPERIKMLFQERRTYLKNVRIKLNAFINEQHLGSSVIFQTHKSTV